MMIMAQKRVKIHPVGGVDVDSRAIHQPRRFVIPAQARQNHMSPHCRTEKDAIRSGGGGGVFKEKHFVFCCVQDQ